MAGAIERGLTLADFEEMEIGAIVDYVITYNNMHFSEDKKDSKKNGTYIRRATQDDWDRFASS